MAESVIWQDIERVSKVFSRAKGKSQVQYPAILHSQPWNDVFIPYLIFLCMHVQCIATGGSYIHSMYMCHGMIRTDLQVQYGNTACWYDNCTYAASVR